MRDRTFLETTDALREAACCVAGHFPHLPYQIYPSVRVERARLGLLPATPEDDREDDMAPDPVRVACGRAPRRVYDVGTAYGRLRVVSIRPTNWAGGKLYTCACEACGAMNEYAAGALNLAERRNRACAECMLRKVVAA